MSLEKIQQLKASLQERFKDLIDEETKPLFEAFIFQLIFKEKLQECTQVSICLACQKVLKEKIYLDNFAYSLISKRNNIIEIHEALPATLEKLRTEKKINIEPPFLISTSYQEYLVSNKEKYPLCQGDIPAGFSPKSLIETSAVVLVARNTDTNQLINHQIYDRDTLLDGVGRKIVGDKLIPSINPLTWNTGNNGMEMLKKTALRKYIKHKTYLL